MVGPNVHPNTRDSEATMELNAAHKDLHHISSREQADSLWERYESQANADPALLDAAIQATQVAIEVAQEPSERARPFGQLGNRLHTRYNLKGALDDLNGTVAAFQKAVELLSDDDPNQIEVLNRLGISLRMRFARIGDVEDINSAATAFCCAVELASDDNNGKPIVLFNYSLALRERFTSFGDPDDLEPAIWAQRRAVALGADGDPDEPLWFNNLGSLLHAHFGRTGTQADLDQAISAHSRAVELVPDGQPKKPSYLNDLGGSLAARFNLCGDLADIDQAISACRRTVELMPDGNPDNPFWLENLGNALHLRYQRTSVIQDLEHATSAQRRAAELAPDGHPKRPALFNRLGVFLWTLYQRTGKLEDLDQSILAHRRSIELTPDAQRLDLAQYNNQLSGILYMRFGNTRELQDLDKSISALRCVLELLPSGHPFERTASDTLGNYLLVRFKRTGELGDLERAVSAHHRAVEVTSDGHPAKASLLQKLGSSLRTRFLRTGETKDIERALSAHRLALELTPDGHPDKPQCFSNLGSSLTAGFERNGELADIEQAISLHRRAIELTADDHHDKPSMLNDIGVSLLRRFERTYELEDVSGGILALRRAVELTPDDDPDKPMWLNHLGNLLSARFRLRRTSKGLEDLEESIASYRRAVALSPDAHHIKAALLAHLCQALWTRFDRTCELSDIEDALVVGQSAIALLPKDHPRRVLCYNSLALCLQRRFEHSGDIDDIKSAINMLHEMLKLIPDGDPYLSPTVKNLGTAQLALFESTQSRADFDAGIAYLMESTLQPSATPRQRFESANTWMAAAVQYPAFSSVESTMSAVSRIMDILPEIVWLGYGIHRRYEESSQLGKIVTDAVSFAILANALPRAVEWLETGRALIWSQVLSLRSPVDELQVSHPVLAVSFSEVQRHLQWSVYRSSAPDIDAFGGIPGLTVDSAADDHRALVIKFDGLLKEIRGLTGFEDFLRSKPFQDLVGSLDPDNGPVVFINVAGHRCDALVLSHGGDISLVPLPNLSLKRAKELRQSWSDNLTRRMVRARGLVPLDELEDELNPLHATLECLWKWVVEPVLQALDLSNPTQDGRLPCITWCPTGPLTQLPLHAAGMYNEPHGPRVYDFIVSSYTPSLSALSRSSHAEAAKHEAAPPKMLILTQPDTPNLHAPLPGTKAEGRDLRDFLSQSQITTELLEHDQATVGSVRNIMSRYSWVHLACHGSQHPHDPTQSAFHLYDGPLTLADFMGTAVTEHAELAFLSACETAVGDEHVPEESAHLAAGMLAVGFKGVIATMWSIRDADAPVVVEAYYKELIALREDGVCGKGRTGAGYALHEATRVLREKVGESNFIRWVPFVHFGV